MPKLLKTCTLLFISRLSKATYRSVKCWLRTEQTSTLKTRMVWMCCTWRLKAISQSPYTTSRKEESIFTARTNETQRLCTGLACPTQKWPSSTCWDGMRKKSLIWKTLMDWRPSTWLFRVQTSKPEADHSGYCWTKALSATSEITTDKYLWTCAITSSREKWAKNWKKLWPQTQLTTAWCSRMCSKKLRSR